MSRKKHRTYVDLHVEKYTPSPKVKPEELIKTAKSMVPVLAKDSKGRTICDFPSLSVTLFPDKKDDEITNINRVQAEVEMMPVDLPGVAPTERGELFIRSFLVQIKRRMKFLIRQINAMRDAAVQNHNEIEEVRTIAEKSDNDLWNIRMEFDGLNSKMDAILEIFESWGVPVDDYYNKTSDTPPLDYGTEDGQNDVTGEDVAKAIRTEEAYKRAKRISESQSKLVNLMGGNRKSISSKSFGAAFQGTATPTPSASIVVPATAASTSTHVVEPIKTTQPLPPTDLKKTDKTNTIKTTNWNKDADSHFCDMCKFAEPAEGKHGKGVRCKHLGSKYSGEIIYGTRQCAVYASATLSPAKITEVCGFDFSDAQGTTH